MAVQYRETTIRRLVLLNTPVLTNYGHFIYEKVEKEEAQALMNTFKSLKSAIGHTSTAVVLGKLFGRKIPVNRITYRYRKGDLCLVFKLKERLQWYSKKLTVEDIEKVGYYIGIIYQPD